MIPQIEEIKLSLSLSLYIKDALSAMLFIYYEIKQPRIVCAVWLIESIGENGQKWKNAKEMVHSRITALDLSHSIIHNTQMLINHAH